MTPKMADKMAANLNAKVGNVKGLHLAVLKKIIATDKTSHI